MSCWSQIAPSGAGGEDTDAIALRFGASHSDNIREVAQMPESGAYSLLGLISDWSRSGLRLSAAMNADLEYRNYSVSGLENELYGYASIIADVGIMPERFIWQFAEYIANGRPDAFAYDTPDNRDVVNVFSTGPRLNLPLGQRTSMSLQANAESRSVKDDPTLDSDVLDASLSATRQIRPTADVGLHLSDRDIEYEQSRQEAEILAAYLSYSRTLPRGSASIAVGQSEFDDGVRSDSTPYLHIDWASEIGTRSNWSVAVSQQFIDAFQDANFVDGADLILSDDIYEYRALQFGFDTQVGRNDISLSTSFGESEYSSDISLNNDELIMNVGWNRAVAARLSVGLDLMRWKRDYVELGRKDDDIRRTIYVQRDFAGPFSLEFSYERRALAGLDEGEVKDDAISVYFDYALSGG